jgi:hypothetical protein
MEEAKQRKEEEAKEHGQLLKSIPSLERNNHRA